MKAKIVALHIPICDNTLTTTDLPNSLFWDNKCFALSVYFCLDYQDKPLWPTENTIDKNTVNTLNEAAIDDGEFYFQDLPDTISQNIVHKGSFDDINNTTPSDMFTQDTGGYLIIVIFKDQTDAHALALKSRSSERYFMDPKPFEEDDPNNPGAYYHHAQLNPNFHLDFPEEGLMSPFRYIDLMYGKDNILEIAIIHVQETEKGYN